MGASRARIRPQITDPFPAPVDPAMSRWVPCSRTSQRVPSSQRPTGRARRAGRGGVGAVGDGEGGDDGGEGVASDQFQGDPAGPGGANAALVDGEPGGDVVGAVGEVGGGLAGDEADGDEVGARGGGDLAKDGDQDTAAV